MPDCIERTVVVPVPFDATAFHSWQTLVGLSGAKGRASVLESNAQSSGVTTLSAARASTPGFEGRPTRHF
jgi:hypothetical protein